MTEEKFNQVKDLYEKISGKKESIRQIDRLISSCGLNCQIGGTIRGTFTRSTPYNISNKELIVKMLKVEKETIESELVELEKSFSEQ